MLFRSDARRAALLVLLVLVALVIGAPPTGRADVVRADSAGAPHAGRAGTPERAPQAGGWRAPLEGEVRVVGPFDPPTDRYGAGHRGVDLGGDTGITVLAAGAGTVRFAGPVGGRGVISVQHSDGLRTTYEPVSAQVLPGTRVVVGTPLGRLDPGHRGCPVAACLHWGLLVGAEYRNPLVLLGFGRVRLYPVTT